MSDSRGLTTPATAPAEQEYNDLGQPIGFAVAGWRPPRRPARDAIVGRYFASAFERWLDPANFDAEGCQRLRLSELTAFASADDRRVPQT